MKITTIVAGPKPLKLLSSGETKKTFEVKCQGLYENGLGRYKAWTLWTWEKSLS